MKRFKEFLREEADTLSQPQIDTKTNNQISNDSFVTNVAPNKTSVKNSLKRTPSDIRKPDEYDEIEKEYQEWFDGQMKAWEKANPYPVLEDWMSQQDYQQMCQIWENEYNEYASGRYNHYVWDRFGGHIPLPPDYTRKPTRDRYFDVDPPDPSPSVGGSGLGQQHGTPGY